MRLPSVEGSTLIKGEKVKIPGGKTIYQVGQIKDGKIHLYGPAGGTKTIAASDFVYLAEERQPAALTTTYPLPSRSENEQAARLQPLWQKIRAGIEGFQFHMTTHLVRRELISLHPALATVPMMGAVAERFLAGAKPEHKKAGQEMANEKAALWANLDRDGILEPVKAYREGRKWIMCDGRHRLEWSDARNKFKVPLIEVTKDQASAIIESTVVGRRHWSKGMRAYMGVMLHPEVADNEGSGRIKKTDSVGFVANATELAKRLGISQDIVLQACQLYRAFFAPGYKSGTPEAIEAASLKEQYEMSIWAGNGLGAVLAGIEGGKATGGKMKAESGFHGLDKPLGTFSRFSSLYTTWTPEERTKAQQLMVVKFKGMSSDFRLAVSEALAAAEVTPAA